MNASLTASPTPSPQQARSSPGRLPRVGLGQALATSASTFGLAPNDEGFVALQGALRASGGLARCDELALGLQRRQAGGYVSLARLIVTQRVTSFAWNNSFWLPMFQFDASNLSLRPEHQPALAELIDVLDGWALALWFVQGNASLSGCTPLALLHSDPEAVFQAARLQRYVMTA